MEKDCDDLIYFTSDLHLGHRGIIEMQKRPFENVEGKKGDWNYRRVIKGYIMNNEQLKNFGTILTKNY